VALLRRVLYLDALVTAVIAVVLIPFPGFVFEDMLGQPAATDYTLVRLLGASLLPFALLMVLIGHRVQELWWWCWAFVILEGMWGVVLTLEAAFGVPTGTAPGFWWLSAAVAWGFALAYLWGIARAAGEAGPA
jgi:hypothetical protein